MTEGIADSATRDWTFDTLRKRPDALISALDHQGFQIPMPDDAEVPEDQRIPLPHDRATLIDLFAPGYGLKSVSVWERAEKRGLAMGEVRLTSDPDRQRTLTYLDLRHRFGSWMGVLTNSDSEAEAGGTEVLGALQVSKRPRTASVKKTWAAYVTDVDERTTRMLGWTPEQLIGVKTTEFLHPDDHERALASWMEMLSKKETQRVRFRHRRSDGTWLWVETENVYHHADVPEDIVVVANMTDISDEMAAYDALDKRERLFRRLAESMPTGLLQLDVDGSVVYANTRLGDIIGVRDGSTLDDWLATVADTDRAALSAAVGEVLEVGTDHNLEVAVALPDGGERRRCAINLVALTDRVGTTGALICVTDVTDSARLRAELEVKATFDALTGCYNRASVMVALEHAIAADARPPAVIFVDMDKFKPVNDTLGHAAGDELLVDTANSLSTLLRHDDIIGRIGGDEFLLLCRQVDGPNEAMVIAERVRDTMHRKVTLTAGTVDAGASIGVAIAAPGEDGDTVVAHADAAMYESKRARTGRPMLYKEE